MKDMKAKILSNEEVAPGYYRMVLEGPYMAKTANPGQFVMVRCGNDTDPLLRRPLGISRVRRPAAPGAMTMELLYEVIGRGTEILANKRKGETLKVLGPLGNGFDLLPCVRRPASGAVLIAGGIGVAPMIFLAEEMARKKIRPVILIGAKTKKLILCEKEFKRIGAEVHIATDDGTLGRKGFVSGLLQDVLRRTPDTRYPTVYACGPEPMLRAVAGICLNKKIECQISMETKMACGIGACLGCAVETKKGNKLACKDGPVFNARDLFRRKA
ncbi:MAG: dihydroorotate dehydrogenase electron transfer subunit [Candidatus Omnitrophota bacterium]